MPLARFEMGTCSMGELISGQKSFSEHRGEKFGPRRAKRASSPLQMVDGKATNARVWCVRARFDLLDRGKLAIPSRDIMTFQHGISRHMCRGWASFEGMMSRTHKGRARAIYLSCGDSSELPTPLISIA